MKPRAAAILAILLIAASLAASAPARPRNPLKIAILPWGNDSPGGAFAAGRTAFPYEVIHRLTYIRALTVRPMEAGLPYLSNATSAGRIRAELDVDVFLTGSYRRGEDTLSVDLLLRGSEGDDSGQSVAISVRFAEAGSLPAMIAGEICRLLKVSLSQDEKTKLKGDAPADGAAYDSYLQGVAARLGPPSDLEASLRLLKRSVERDPSFAPALSALGDSYLLLSGEVGGLKGFYREAEEAFTAALRLNPAMPTTLQQFGMLHTKTGSSEKAAVLFKQGLRLNPNVAALYAGLGYVFRYAGRMRESIDMYRRAARMDASAKNRIDCGMQILKSQIYLGAYRRAERTFQEVLALHAEQGSRPDEKDLFYGGVVRLYAGDKEGAVSLFDAALAEDPKSLWSAFGKAYREALLGRNVAVADIAAGIEERNEVDGERRYRLVHIYALAGRPRDALRMLESSIAAGFFNYPCFRKDPLLAGLRAEKEFASLLNLAKDRHLKFKTK